jgi:hypothetical protein
VSEAMSSLGCTEDERTACGSVTFGRCFRYISVRFPLQHKPERSTLQLERIVQKRVTANKKHNYQFKSAVSPHISIRSTHYLNFAVTDTAMALQLQNVIFSCCVPKHLKLHNNIFDERNLFYDTL